MQSPSTPIVKYWSVPLRMLGEVHCIEDGGMPKFVRATVVLWIVRLTWSWNFTYRQSDPDGTGRMRHDRRTASHARFGGAGTVALVAARMGHRSISVDINPDYTTESKNRVGKELGRRRRDHDQTIAADDAVEAAE